MLKQRGLVHRWRRKKYQTKRCLREIKRHWAAWQQIDVDTKDLTDLPEYWLQAKMLGLPTIQYTARDVSAGALSFGYADELALTYAEVTTAKTPKRSTNPGFGSLFLASLAPWRSPPHPSRATTAASLWAVGRPPTTAPSRKRSKPPAAPTAPLLLCEALRSTSPPGQHRFQADVETVHGLMERVLPRTLQGPI